jgi:hypothetical protein
VSLQGLQLQQSAVAQWALAVAQLEPQRQQTALAKGVEPVRVVALLVEAPQEQGLWEVIEDLTVLVGQQQHLCCQWSPAAVVLLILAVLVAVQQPTAKLAAKHFVVG